MPRHLTRSAFSLLVGASLLSCTDTPTSLRQPLAPQLSVTASMAAPEVVISQIYGGGGNSGATYKNDFIELFNPGSQPVSLVGWSVQYASAGGSTWQVTPLSGTIQPGKYYLVREAAGTGGTADLPAPDVTTGPVPLPAPIPMSATAGKVWLVRTTTALTGTCPTTSVVDKVSYGTTATDCGLSNTATLSNPTAAIRNDSGCAYSGDLRADFAVGAPTPRNSSSPTHLCPGIEPVGPLHHVAVAGPTTVIAGSTIQLTATAQDANNQTVTTATITWLSGSPSIATVDGTGAVTGVSASVEAVTITATAVDGDITKSGAIQVTVNTPGINWIDVSSSSTSFPPGFQTQLFATARVSQNGAEVPATFTFEAVNPEIATITAVQNTAIVTGVAAPANGTTRPGLRITATPVGSGTPYVFVTHSIFIETPVVAPTSIYGPNDEFGHPTPASASNPNDFLIRRPQYTLSYNQSRGTPNWVSYELDARQMGSEDRCNCFSADPLLPADKRILTSDYTNGGYDRGHMARSADRTAANADNASTYYLTNIVPQTGDLNQGVWAQFENALGDSARLAGRAVYIITGPLYSRSQEPTFIKNEGKVAIPDRTWKVALIGPRNAGNPFTRANVQEWTDLAGLTILAVDMPNVTGVRNDPWAKYLTTVDKLEEATGYDFLSLLSGAFQDALEANDHAPVSHFSVGGPRTEGGSLTFDASGSTDPDFGRTDLGRAEALTYAWQFSDGTTASGRTVTKTFSRDGSYSATLVVTDAFGWPNTTTQALAIANVAPSVAPLAGASLIAGETYRATGSFADPGADSWTGTVNYGDGGSQTLALSGKTFTLAHQYHSAGTFTVTVSITDDGGGRGSATATVSVQTPAAAARGVGQMVNALEAAGALTEQESRALLASLNAAVSQIERGNNTAATNQLDAFLNKLDAAVRSGRVSPSVARDLSASVQRIQRVLGG